jgi:hypothetical protein
VFLRGIIKYAEPTFMPVRAHPTPNNAEPRICLNEMRKLSYLINEDAKIGAFLKFRQTVT